MEESKMKFNERLIKLRKENALSQEELGEKLNVTRQTVSKWELGQTTPDMDKLVEMAKLFNVTTDELLKETDEKEEANTSYNNKEGANKKNIAIIVILLVVLFALIAGITYSIGSKAGNKKGGFFENFFNKAFSAQENFIDKNEDKIVNMFDKALNTLDKYESKMDEQDEQDNKKWQENREKFQETKDKIQEDMNKQMNTAMEFIDNIGSTMKNK